MVEFFYIKIKPYYIFTAIIISVTPALKSFRLLATKSRNVPFIPSLTSPFVEHPIKLRPVRCSFLFGFTLPMYFTFYTIIYLHSFCIY